MIAIDASAVADWLMQTPLLGPAVARELLSAGHPQTLDFAHVEVLSVLRRKARMGELSEERAAQVLTDLGAAPFRRHTVAPLAGRIWELRHALTAYDAAYVALAEALAVPLLTTDARLARSGGHRAKLILAGT